MGAFSYYIYGMKNEAYEQAKINALEKVFLSIAETGKPTKEQIDFINMMKPKRSEFDEMKDAGSMMMSLMGFMEGK